MLYEVITIARMSKLIHAAERQHMPRIEIRHVAQRAVEMLRQSLDAFARLDVAEAMRVVKEDSAIDDEFRAIMRHRITSYNVCYTKLLRIESKNAERT